ncbi:MAG: GNAT family N-acetyltransferase [Bacillota bacterium]|nr:GNAT family N-acetyltransferase [Bacillota bacterium]
MDNLKLVYAYDRPDEVGELFKEYTDMLIAGDRAFAEYLKLQKYDKELKNPASKYGMPEGRLYLAYYEDQLAGCVGLKKLDEEGRCELKRMYVRPQFRGKKMGERLLEVVLKDAKEIGYTAMLLDTLPFLESAIRMYRKKGFYEIPSYNDSPLDTTIYMKIDL